MRHGHNDILTYWLSGLRQADEHPLTLQWNMAPLPLSGK